MACETNFNACTVVSSGARDRNTATVDLSKIIMEKKVEKVVDKFKGYVEMPEVKETYAAMKTNAKCMDTGSFLTTPNLISTLEKSGASTLAENIRNAVELAALLGPAGVALGVGVDLMVAVGLLEDASMMKLDELSRHVVKRNFENFNRKIAEALNCFLPIINKILAYVLRYEQILASRAGDVNGFFERLEDLAKECSPSKVIVALRQIHVLITGEAMFQSKPLFKQLAEEANELEGAAFDQFVSALLLQFQVVLGLEMRAVRMLRSFIALQGKDAVYSNDVKTIFEHLALQRREHDPCLELEWYLKLMAFGGQMTMTTKKLPDWHLCMAHYQNSFSNTYYVKFCEGHPGDQGVVNVTPHPDGGKFLLSVKKWPNRFLYFMKIGKVGTWEGDPGPEGHWIFTVKHLQTRTVKLTTCKWPEWHAFMFIDQYKRNNGLRTKIGNPDPLGQFILSMT